MRASSKYAFFPQILMLAAAFVCGGLYGQEPPPDEPASLVIRNGRVWTANPEQPWAEAVAIRGERLLMVGTTKRVEALIGPHTRVVDARDRLIVPGFIDTHVHFIDGGFRLSSVQLRDAGTREAFIARIEAYAKQAEPGSWITGGDWDHTPWGGILPEREWIDAVTPNHPVWITRLDGHMGLANSLALKAAGVTRDTPDMEGGAIVRDTDGEPTGILKDNAMALIYKAIPDPSDAQKDKALAAAMAYVSAQGITSIHNMGSWSDLAVFERARERGGLMTRIYAAVPLPSWTYMRDRVAKQGYGDSWLRIGGLKGFVDGSLGSHTAAFLEPFTDTPGDRGLLVNTEEKLHEWVSGADKAGLQVMVHAIGDRAIRLQLDIFERVASENGPHDRRFRIEHAQHIAPADIGRFGKLGVIPSMQPYHAIDDGRWAEHVIGRERAKTTYAFRALLDADAKLALGSDWFVAPPKPLMGIYAAVTRRTLDEKNPGGWVPEQKIGIDEALRGFTISAAYASFEEKDKGSLQKGKLADVAIIDRDLFQIEPATIRDARILMTIVGGRVVFERNARP